jgi:predicted ArsR family transcriptional regulator
MPDIDDSEFEGELERSQAETRAAFENRALMYAYVYEEMADDLGEERATELMKRAIHRRGLEVGRKYRAAVGAGDLEAVGRIFCDGSPCNGELFEPGIEEEGDDRIVLRMTACPLMDAWREAGLNPEELDHMCDIAAAVDEGTFEAAGLELTFLDRLGRPGSERCLLELRLPDRR